MKKGSGFEKFFKGKEKTGGAKKEAIRQEKREVRKEREEKIANAKRQKRAQYKAAANNEPPKYNLEPPTSRFQKKSTDQRNKPSFKIEKRTADSPGRSNRQDGPKPFKRDDNRFDKNNDRRFEKKDPRYNGGKETRGTGNRDNRNVGPKNNRFSGAKENKFSGPKEQRGESSKKQFGRNTEVKYNNQKLQPVKPEQREVSNTPPLKPKLKTPLKPLTDQMPLNKYIAHSGVCSRRDAVDIIKGGKVKVNGELILEPGHKVALTDDVRVGGKKLNPVKDFVYILLNKPKDYITTTEDPQERKTVLDLLKGAPEVRIYPVGRLDRNTSGVLLLTNDGDLSQKLTHPSNEIKKVYAVTLDKPLTKHHFEEILKGVALEDGIANVDTLAFTDAQDYTQIGVELHTGRNRIVRRIFEHFGYDVKGLDRVIFAGLTKKNVNRGKWRFLTEKEVRDLKFFKKGRS